MAITVHHVAVVRARLYEDVERFEHLWARFGPDDIVAYELLVLAGLRLLLEDRCPRGGTPREVIELVGDIRSRTRWRADNVDPLAAESLYKRVLGSEIPDSAGYDATSPNGWYLFLVLAADADLNETDVTDLLTRARQLADEWIIRRSQPAKQKERWWPWRR